MVMIISIAECCHMPCAVPLLHKQVPVRCSSAPWTEDEQQREHLISSDNIVVSPKHRLHAHGCTANVVHG